MCGNVESVCAITQEQIISKLTFSYLIFFILENGVTTSFPGAATLAPILQMPLLVSSNNKRSGFPEQFLKKTLHINAYLNSERLVQKLEKAEVSKSL